MKKVAVILAAGIGSRLRPETYEKPKCLVSVEGLPILEYQLNAFEHIETLDEIIIVGGYLVSNIEKYISNRRNKIQTKIIRNQRYLETNNMYSLKLALDALDLNQISELYVTNGDVIIEPQIAIEMERHADSVIAVDKSGYLDESMKVITDEDGLVKDISKNISPSEFSAVSIDFYKFTQRETNLLYKAIREYINKGEENLWTEVAIQKIVKEKNAKIKTVDITGYIWWEIDNKIDKKRAEYRLNLLKHAKELKSARIFAFDLDGTIILGKHEISGASRLIDFLLEKGKNVYFITNNSSMPNSEHYKRISKILTAKITPEMIYSSLDYIGEVLNEKAKTKRVYALLPRSSQEYLTREYNITFTESNPDIVLVGFDIELTYEKLEQASIYIQQGADFYLIHPDLRCPTDRGFIPDAGSIGKVLELTTKRKPDVIGGKPNPEVLKRLAKIHSVSTEQICYIGDRIETDIEMAIKSYSIPILFLTGETSFEDIYANDALKDKIVLGENPIFFEAFLRKHWEI